MRERFYCKSLVIKIAQINNISHFVRCLVLVSHIILFVNLSWLMRTFSLFSNGISPFTSILLELLSLSLHH